jgi:hypothetical protein
MKLKLIASMSVLGLISISSVGFASTANPANPANQANMPTKHKHHYRHHVVRTEPVAHPDYKDMGSLPVLPAAEVCTISPSTIVMDQITQSIGRAMPNACNPGWFNRIQFSGGINVDLGKWGNRNANIMGENYQRLSLNDAYLNVAANVNDWTKAFASISYNTATINDPINLSSLGFFAPSHVGEYSSAYSNNANGGSSNALQLEQAYATIGNFDMSPFFVQVGKQFQDFSRYEIHPITRSLTQVMSETLATSGKVGFIANGFNGSVYVFDTPISKVGHSSTRTDYGIALGYDQPSDELGWDIGAAYLNNLIGVNDIAYNVTQFTGGGYHTRVGGAAVYADINSGPFSIGARYTTALQRFNQGDLPHNGLATSTDGAKPWAAGIQAGYGFDAFCGRPQNIYLGYQASRQAAGLSLPKSRWLAGYGIDVWKSTNFGIEWDHDTSYSVSHGGEGHHSGNLVSLRAAVQFG